MKKSNLIVFLLCACLTNLLAFASPADPKVGVIAYDIEDRRVWVSGFPEEYPATLSDILAADEREGWGIINYNAAEDTFTLKASLWIGNDQDAGTFLQIGRPAHPRETLVLYGDLRVNAPSVSGQRYDSRYMVSNRLTMGDPLNPDLKPSIKIACAKPGEFSVETVVGPVPEDNNYRPLGGWFMFNGSLSALDPANRYRASMALSHAGVNYHMFDSRFSDWDGKLFNQVVTRVDTWVPEKKRLLRGMTFENGGILTDGSFLFVDCLFSNLTVGTGVGDALRCVYRGNRDDFRLTTGHTGVILTDCVFEDTGEPLKVIRSRRSENWLRNYSVYRDAGLPLLLNPGIIERVSLQVLTLDEQGQPLRRAVAVVKCPADDLGIAVRTPLAVTGADGMTPGDARDRALVVNHRELRPTDDPLNPEIVTRVYHIKVAAEGYAESEVVWDSAQPVPRPLTVQLSRLPP